MDQKTDFCVVRSTDGVLHRAQVVRYFKEGRIDTFGVATACIPVMAHRYSHEVQQIKESELGDILLTDYHTIIREYDVQEAPTCMKCMTIPDVFR